MTSHKIKELAVALSGEAVGDTNFVVSGISEPATAKATDLAVAMDKTFVSDIPLGQAKCAILAAGADWQSLGLDAAILIERPRLALAGLTAAFDNPGKPAAGIHETAIVDPGADVAPNASIGPYCVIGAGVVIAEDVQIGAHVMISEGSRIGAGTLILSGVHIGHNVSIGSRCILHSGVTIGADGFSFVTETTSIAENVRANLDDAEIGQTDQEWIKIHSLGGVKIGDRVEIGANSNVDAGTLRATEIGDGTKLDSLVQLGHNVRIGKNCLLCGQVGVAGSTIVGDAVILGGQVGIADNLKIGDGVVVGAGTIVMSNVPAGRAMLGYPAVRMSRHVEIYKSLRRLPEALRDLRRLQELVSKRNDND